MFGHLSLTGAGIGMMFGLGCCLVLWRLAARQVRLIDRVSPYLRDQVGTSRLLEAPATHTPFPTVERMLRPVIGDAAAFFERLGSTTISIRRRLVRAGYPMTVEQFRTEQVIWCALGLAAGLLFSFVLAAARGTSVAALVVLVALAGLAGVLARDYMLTRQVQAREKRIVTEFPTIAELLALAVGAGEAPVAALDRVARTTRGELSGELTRTLADVRSGRSLTDALEGLSQRTDLPGIARFAEGVATAVDRGTPLADVLRAQAQDARRVGHRALMEEGGKREIAMMVPVVFLLLPISVVFAVFPGLAVLSL
ncbi:type II secretion system F family protein [Ruania alkalisoli]|uniref:Type II secretion system F family protein n=1 Tax=Ruania alkalisoli TaxID=2779775 RepID=A0A7M1SW96_9MICO|nr:type II secretion system F family protein [Ruania alkalisoli]QOR71860.1 type II secretion system F family protein [Ruania alkalisoli]